jgi:hypothetical protein
MKLAPILAVITAVLFVSVAMSAQFPNELEGYKFFTNGKLKGLQLLASNREEVKRLLGSDCEKQCDYDANWTIEFQFFDEIWTREESNSRGDRRVYKLDPKYLGKLRQIDLKPKQAVSFASISYPAAFSKTIVTAAPDRNDPRSGARSTVYDSFGDATGLSYQLFGPANPPGMPGSHMYKPGELVMIRYTIPKEREKSLFVLEK